MRKNIKIKFVSFWPTFNPENNKFTNALKLRHDIEVLSSDSKDTPDILFYSRCGYSEHLKYDCLKIYFTGENDFPDFNECDYAISFYDLKFGNRHMRYPLYMFYETDKALQPEFISDEQAVDRGFCSLLMRNFYNCDRKRIEIIDAIQSYKPIAYGGPFRNNVGGLVAEKIPFISKYKFNLALENSYVDGYVTEKLLEPLAASTVPIYWGSDYSKKDFNPDSFINVNDYNSLDSLLKDLKRIDENSSDYLKILRAPNFKKQSLEDFDSHLVDFLDNIAVNMKRHIIKYGEMNVLHNQKKYFMPITNNKILLKISKIMSRF